MKHRRSLALAAVALAAIAAIAARPRSSGSVVVVSFAIVVNEANPSPGLKRAEIADLFLRKASKWADGTAAAPVDLPDDSPVRGAFSRSVLGRDAAAVASYWQQQIFSGGAVPPPQKRNSRDVLAFVRENRGAIGYIDGDEDVVPGTRLLQVTD